MTALGPERVAELLDAHGLTARRSLGQNFVVDPSVIDRIVELAHVGADEHVVEIGPGLGSLTASLAASGAEVVAIEKDPALADVLRDVLSGRAPAEGRDRPPVRVVEADALSIDWDELLRGADRWVAVANLPYNVAVPILMSVLQGAPMVERLVVMVQQEVGARLVARPGGRTIGIPSIATAWYASARIAATVGPDAFLPRPRVTSVVVEMTRRPPPRDDVDPQAVMSLAAAAYRQRRKMLRSSLSGRVDASQFARAGIAATKRPEELDVGEWADLSAVVDGVVA